MVTLIVVALISLGAAYFATRVAALRDGAELLQTSAEAERDAHSSQQMLALAAATYPISVRGLEAPEGVLALDDRAYQIGEHTRISVQDERGLINLNVSSEALLRRFLATLGLPLDRQSRLIDTLLDYIDIDDFKRINGAEREDYEKLGLPPPANNFLATPEELRQIPGWIELFRDLYAKGGQAAVERVLRLTAAHRFGGINLNTAPREVLRAVSGIDPSRVSALIDQRRTEPFTDLSQAVPFTNGPMDTENTLLVSTNSWRVTHSRDDLPFLLECRLLVTPSAVDLPVHINQCRRRVRDVIPVSGNDDAALLVGSLNPDPAGGGIQGNTRSERELNSQPLPAETLSWLALPASRR